MAAPKIGGSSSSRVIAVRINTLIILTSLLVALVCFWNRKDVPLDGVLHPGLADDPRQTSTRARPFDASFNDVDYRVAPEFDYELIGLVVSYRHHDGESRMHRRAQDHLNMLDVCVIWGDNTRHPNINELTFFNGIFTCNVSTRDQAAWQAFDIFKLSNNHLISDKPAIRDRVADIAIGDQIRVRGKLASYTGPTGTRGTSTTRMDTGDGACETIYVESFEILHKGRSPWVQGLYASMAVFLLGVVVHFRRPYRPYRGQQTS